MSEMIVYHGGTEKIERPICKFGRPNLDFGQGFYITNLRQQAESWANNMARNRKKPATKQSNMHIKSRHYQQISHI